MSTTRQPEQGSAAYAQAVVDAKPPAVIEFDDPSSPAKLRLVLTDTPVVEVNTHTDATGARSWSLHDFTDNNEFEGFEVAAAIPGLMAAVLASAGWTRAEVRPGTSADGDWFGVYVGDRAIAEGFHLRATAEARAERYNSGVSDG